jgi:predicted Zn-dependent peptidase
MKFTKRTLPNGLRILTVPMKDNETVTVMALVETGSDYEAKDQGGISHFLEHMCFKGTQKRPNSQMINYEFDAMGSQSNAFTTSEYTGFYAKAHHAHLPKVLDLISDVFVNSTFPEAEIEKEKGVVIEEINMYEDRPDYKVYEVIEELMYGDQPAGRSTLGTKETVQSLSREKILDYRNMHYAAENTLIVVSGKVDEETIYSDIEKAFASISTNKKPEKPAVLDEQIAPALKIQHKDSFQCLRPFSARA